MAPRQSKTDAPEVIDAADTVAALQTDAAAHALAVNKAFGVTEYNLNAAMSRLRGLMATASQTMLEIGETLALIHAHETADAFREVLTTTGLEVRVAQRMMQAARKFRLALTKPQAAALRDLSRGTLLELLVLDDEEVAELANGGTVLDMTLDEVAAMPTSKLRAELRKLRAEKKEADETAQRQLEAKNTKLDEMDAQLIKYTQGNRDVEARLAADRETFAVESMQAASIELLGAIQRFGLAVADCLADGSPTRRELAHGATSFTFQRIAQIALEHQFPVDFESVVNPFGELEG